MHCGLVEREAADANSNVPTRLTFNYSSVSNLENSERNLRFFSKRETSSPTALHWLLSRI